MNASRSIGQNAAMEPLSPTKSTSGQSRNTGSPSHMPIGVPSQTMSFGNTDHGMVIVTSNHDDYGKKVIIGLFVWKWKNLANCYNTDGKILSDEN